MKKFLILFISLFLTGCYNYHELSDLAIVTGIGLDKTNNNYKMSLLIVNSTNDNESNTSSPTIVTGKGININSAYEDAITKVSKNLYLGHLSLILIDEEISKNNLLDVVDSFVRDPKTIRKIKVAIAKKTTSNEILKIISPLDTFPQENIISNINNSLEVLGISHNTYLSNIIYNTVNEGIDNVIPTLSIEKQTSKNGKDDIENKISIKVDELAIFKNNKLTGYLNYNQSKIFNILKNETTTTLINTKCGNNKYETYKLTNPKTKINLNNNTYNIEVNSNAILLETNCNTNLKNKEEIKKLERKLEKEIKELINNTLEYAYKLDSDILGLGNIMYKKDYNKFKEIKNNYIKYINYKINVNITINEIGTLERKLNEKN